MCDLGWEKMIQSFNIYGQAGGSKEDKAVTEEIIATITEERDCEQHLPTLITGDVNADPEKLQGLAELVEEEGWVDVGLHADWWEEETALPTCESRP